MRLAAVVAGVGPLAATAAVAAEPKSHQVTGPVLAVKGDVIASQKGEEKLEIARDKETKVAGDVKVGSKVGLCTP